MLNPVSLVRDFGFHLLPVLADKRPACRWKPLQTRRASIGLVKQWLGRGHGLGVCTGQASRLVVVDTDDQAAEDWVAEHLPETPWVVLTGVKPDGFRGRHRYYRYPSGTRIANSAGVLVGRTVLKVDVRADGGYVVAPGSPHASGVVYEPTKTWSPDDYVPVLDPAMFQRAQRKSLGGACSRVGSLGPEAPWTDSLDPAKLAKVADLLGLSVEQLLEEANA